MTRPYLPVHAINVFVPLVDLRAANGPTEFVPESHRFYDVRLCVLLIFIRTCVSCLYPRALSILSCLRLIETEVAQVDRLPVILEANAGDCILFDYRLKVWLCM